MADGILKLPPVPADRRVRYGPAPSQFADLRLPHGKPGPLPVVVVVHGGFWRARYSLDHIGHLCAALAAAGVATWSIEYRRIGEAGGGWPNTLRDAAAAVDHLRAVAPEAGLDLGRVVTLGHSAGGHLALWLAGRHRVPPAAPVWQPQPLSVCGVVALAPVADLRLAASLRLGNDVTLDLLGGPPAAVPERYAAASPAELLPLGARQVLVHGVGDTIVPLEISRRYHELAAAAGDEVDLVEVPDCGHFEVIDPRGSVWPVVHDAVRRLVG